MATREERFRQTVTNYNFSLGAVLITTILAGTFLMALSVFTRNASGTENTTQDILPFATGLLGFASGLVTALFGRRMEESHGGNGGGNGSGNGGKRVKRSNGGNRSNNGSHSSSKATRDGAPVQ
jgi:hypothetical protein